MEKTTAETPFNPRNIKPLSFAQAQMFEHIGPAIARGLAHVGKDRLVHVNDYPYQTAVDKEIGDVGKEVDKVIEK